MANNPSTLPGYNGQTAAPDANYTYGSARNDAAPGDLTGTPRIAAELNDMFGFQQALLNLANIVPNGTPDTVVTSQYLEAIQNVFGTLKSVKQFGAKGDGVANDTAAFTAARAASNGRYFIPEGNYILDASPDVWDDPFMTGDNVTLTIAGAPFDASKCIAGQLKIGAVNDTIVNIDGARSGETIFRISDGSFTGQSHQSYLPWDIRRDSHSFLMSPGTLGGTCDSLWRRSGVNPDPFGNRYAFNFTESSDSGTTPDLWSISYATSDSGSPSFDVALTIQNGTVPEMKFPTMAPLFEQGFSAKRRTTGVFEFQHITNINDAEVKDKTSGNQIAVVDKSGYRLGGIKHTNLTEIPERTDCNNFGIQFGDGQVNTLPDTKTIYSKVSGTFQSVIIEMTVAFTSSGAPGSFRKTTWHYDGATLTPIDVINTLPVQAVAIIVINGNDLELQTDYTGGLGGGYSMSVMLNYCTAGR